MTSPYPDPLPRTPDGFIDMSAFPDDEIQFSALGLRIEPSDLLESDDPLDILDIVDSAGSDAPDDLLGNEAPEPLADLVDLEPSFEDYPPLEPDRPLDDSPDDLDFDLDL